MSPFGPTREMSALAAEIAAWPEAESLDGERRAWDAVCAPLDASPGSGWEPVDAGGVPAAWARAAGASTDGAAVLYCHGGAFALGSPWHNRDLLTRLSEAADARVLAVDYRLAPEHPYPAALNDTIAAYRWLLETGADPESIVLAGDSCGANLVLGTVLRGWDEGLPTPAGLAAISPWVDLTQSGASYHANAQRDRFVTKESLDYLAGEYLGENAGDDPGASPLFAELSGLPPMLVQVGGGEALLSDSLALAERAGVSGGTVTLEVWPHEVHVWPMWASRLPEGQAAIESIGRFVDAHAERPRIS